MKWISVKDRLPEGGRYLVFVKVKTNFLDYHYISVAELSSQKNGWMWRLDDFEAHDEEDISHWMPLPETPKD